VVVDVLVVVDVDGFWCRPGHTPERQRVFESRRQRRRFTLMRITAARSPWLVLYLLWIEVAMMKNPDPLELAFLIQVIEHNQKKGNCGKRN
jgi:hypothetical protein